VPHSATRSMSRRRTTRRLRPGPGNRREHTRQCQGHPDRHEPVPPPGRSPADDHAVLRSSCRCSVTRRALDIVACTTALRPTPMQARASSWPRRRVHRGFGRSLWTSGDEKIGVVKG
jgi:hypothetical protein